MTPVMPKERWTRVPPLDRRVARGDDFAGDAWLDRETGTTRYTAVGCRPGSSACGVFESLGHGAGSTVSRATLIGTRSPQ